MNTSRKNVIRGSGIAAILGGILLIPGAISLEPPWSRLGSIGALLLIYGVTGIYAAQAEQSGTAGFLGFVFLVAGSFFLVQDNGVAGEFTWLLGVLLSTLGLILLGVGVLKAGKFPRWIAWLWIVSVVVGLPAVFVPTLETALGVISSTAVAIGFAGAGYNLWSQPV